MGIFSRNRREDKTYPLVIAYASAKDAHSVWMLTYWLREPDPGAIDWDRRLCKVASLVMSKLFHDMSRQREIAYALGMCDGDVVVISAMHPGYGHPIVRGRGVIGVEGLDVDYAMCE